MSVEQVSGEEEDNSDQCETDNDKHYRIQNQLQMNKDIITG